MGSTAAKKALVDAGIPYEGTSPHSLSNAYLLICTILFLKAVEQAVVGYVYGDSTCGQRAVYEVGLSGIFSSPLLEALSFSPLTSLTHPGIPIYNVNNNCSTGSTALFMVCVFWCVDVFGVVGGALSGMCICVCVGCMGDF